MKKIHFVSFCFSLLCSFSILANNEKRALLIAIGNYKNSSYWKTLEGAGNDMRLMKTVLLDQKFPEANIISLSNENATKIRIISALENLTKSAQEGDIIVIHFSGHGIQTADLNKDEKDHYDECLVPYDTPAKTARDYTDNALIKDDIIGQWIEKLRAKVKKNGQILLILDACHTGTASKGDNYVSEESLNYTASPYPDPAQNTSLNSYRLKLFKNENSGRFVFIAASADKQVSHQISPDQKEIFGILTYGLFKAFQKIRPGTSYRDLFYSMISVVQNNLRQTPNIEGDISSLVFAGQIRKPGEKFAFHKTGEKEVKLYAGFLNNVNIGAKFEFKKDGIYSSNASSIIAKGVVESSGPFEAIVSITGNIPDNTSNLVAIQTEQAFGGHKIALNIKDFSDKSLQRSLEDNFTNKNIISLSHKNPDLVLHEEGNHVLITNATSGLVYSKISKDENTAQNVINNVLDYGRAKIISALEISNSDFKADVSLRHAIISKEKDGTFRKTFTKDSLSENLVFDTSQQGWFTIKNTGKEPFYFALLDIQPDGIINVLYPNEAKGWNKYNVEIPKNQQKEFPVSGFSKPYGVEIFKVIMSSDYNDFAFLSSLKRNTANSYDSQKGNENPIIALFKDLTDGTMKRTKGNIPFVGGTTEIILTIIPAKK